MTININGSRSFVFFAISASIMMLMLIVFVYVLGQGTKDPSLLEKVSRAYGAQVQGEHTVAIQNYEDLLKEGVEDGPIFFNLASAYFRRGETAKALLFTKIAKYLSPRGEEIGANLTFLRQEQVEKIDHYSLKARLFLFFTEMCPFSLDELMIISLVLTYLFSLIMFFKYTPMQTSSPRHLSPILLGLCSFFFMILLLGKWESRCHNYALVKEKEVAVFSAPSFESVNLFKIHLSHEVFLLENQRVGQENDASSTLWSKIELFDGKKGWIPHESLIRTDFFSSR